MSEAIKVTEVAARAGHRRWVYGPLAPSSQSRIDDMMIRAINQDTVALGVGTFAEDYVKLIRDGMTDIWKAEREIAGYPVVIVPGMCSAAFVNPDHLREITTAEYRAQGIH